MEIVHVHLACEGLVDSLLEVARRHFSHEAALVLDGKHEPIILPFDDAAVFGVAQDVSHFEDEQRYASALAWHWLTNYNFNNDVASFT